ncbi:hypothetical protein GCM10010302_42300 [Streptomyces polychromogenes]|uniref:Uncharacterized protein n=1 Tax=Streptomyces polychromogenes TaxID=67342 RepID=A0ABN0VGH1_9ACTN
MSKKAPPGGGLRFPLGTGDVTASPGARGGEPWTPVRGRRGATSGHRPSRTAPSRHAEAAAPAIRMRVGGS